MTPERLESLRKLTKDNMWGCHVVVAELIDEIDRLRLELRKREILAATLQCGIEQGLAEVEKPYRNAAVAEAFEVVLKHGKAMGLFVPPSP